MSAQQRIQKKFPSAKSTLESSLQLKNRNLTVKTKSKFLPADLKTQLKQARCFGHNITQMKSGEQKKSHSQPTRKGGFKLHTAACGSKKSLPARLRSKMENSFGTSFGNVNIYTDSPEAKSMGALAFTQGNNVHFAPGQYNPQTYSGQALLGHELTHIVQQRAGRVAVPHQSKGAPINADRSLEAEADNLGAKAARGEKV